MKITSILLVISCVFLSCGVDADSRKDNKVDYFWCKKKYKKAYLSSNIVDEILDEWSQYEAECENIGGIYQMFTGFTLAQYYGTAKAGQYYKDQISRDFWEANHLNPRWMYVGVGVLSYLTGNELVLENTVRYLHHTEPDWFGAYFLKGMQYDMHNKQVESLELLTKAQTKDDGAVNSFIDVSMIKALYKKSKFNKIRCIVRKIAKEEHCLLDLRYYSHGFVYAAESFCHSGNYDACHWLLHVADVHVKNINKLDVFKNAVALYEKKSNRKYTRDFPMKDECTNFFHD